MKCKGRLATRSYYSKMLYLFYHFIYLSILLPYQEIVFNFIFLFLWYFIHPNFNFVSILICSSFQNILCWQATATLSFFLFYSSLIICADLENSTNYDQFYFKKLSMYPWKSKSIIRLAKINRFGWMENTAPDYNQPKD